MPIWIIGTEGEGVIRSRQRCSLAAAESRSRFRHEVQDWFPHMILLKGIIGRAIYPCCAPQRDKKPNCGLAGYDDRH